MAEVSRAGSFGVQVFALPAADDAPVEVFSLKVRCPRLKRVISSSGKPSGDPEGRSDRGPSPLTPPQY